MTTSAKSAAIFSQRGFGGGHFLSSLYNSDKLKEQWAPDGSTPYADIARTAFEFARRKGKSSTIVYDFGAGDLEVLSAGIDTGLWESRNCLGIDFNFTNIDPKIQTIELDLSGKFGAKLFELSNFRKFDIGFCTHVLEHLEDPVRFLTELRDVAHPDSLLYLEVPDHNSTLPSDMAAASLYCIQHIHFYSLQSFIDLAKSAGWEVLEATSARHGWVPRLCLMVQPRILDRTRKSYEADMEHTLRSGSALRQKILESGGASQPVVIWGIGSDFHLFINHNDELLKYIKGTPLLVDQRFAGREISGFKIQPTSVLNGFEGKIFCTPFTENSRATMRSVASKYFPKANLVFVE